MIDCSVPAGGIAVSLLRAVDCQLTDYVQGAYGALFGPVGWLAPALTAALTIYIAIFALQLITGRTTLSLSGLVPRIVVIALVVTFATRWSAYETVIYNVLFQGSDEIASLLSVPGGSPAMQQGAGVPERLDNVFDTIADLAGPLDQNFQALPMDRLQTVEQGAEAANRLATQPVHGLKGEILWLSAGVLALGSVGMLVISKVLLGVLLALGPIFIVCGLFSATRGLFEGWLKTSALYAIVPLFTFILTAGVLHLVEPLLAQIGTFQAQDEEALKASFMLAIVTLIFGLLMLQVFRMAARLTGSWRLPNALAPVRNAQVEEISSNASTEGASTANPRLVELLSAVERTGGPVSATAFLPERAQSESFLQHAPANQNEAINTRSRRPLGQFQKRASKRHLAATGTTR